MRQAYLGESLASGTTPGAEPRRPAGGELLGVGHLFTGYGAEPVLHGIDLQVRQGEAVALLGANGAGKTTLMHALAGLHRPVRGGIHFDGAELDGLAAEQVVALGVVLVPEGRQVFPELSVLDNIRLGAFLHPQGADAGTEAMLERFPRLRERLHQRAGLLSGGEQQMLAIARALMSRPRILLLDEPSLGLAPKVIADLFAALDDLRTGGMTLLLVDQMAGLALALADRAYVIEGGRIVAQGAAAEIAASISAKPHSPRPRCTSSNRLTDQRVLVIGGSSGIGEATASQAAHAGAQVTIASRSPDRLAAARARLPRGVTTATLDASDADEVAAFFAAGAPWDHVVVTASATRTGPARALPMRDAEAAMQSKFWSAYHVGRSARIADGGSLTFVSGVYSVRPTATAVLQGAINAALEALARGLALELAPRYASTPCRRARPRHRSGIASAPRARPTSSPA